MEYTRLGKSGLKISKIILGGMSYGSPAWQGWVLPEEPSLPLLKHAYDVGINTWDTANAYSNGVSEEVIGKALKTYNIDRSSVVILTKCFFPVGDPTLHSNEVAADVAANPGKWANRTGLSRKHIFDAVDASVKRLGTYIDVLQIHRLDHDVSHEEIMRALNDVVESGKVRYIGASSMDAWEFQTLQNIADRNGWHKFVSMQNYHNLLYREEEREMIPYCKYTGVHLIPWSPIARGRLTRPYDSERLDPDSKTTREDTDPWTKILNYKSEGDKAVTDRVEEMAKKKGVSMAMVAMVWSLMKGVSPIVGLSSVERIDQAVEAVRQAGKGLLTKEDMTFLEELYRPKPVEGHGHQSFTD